MIDLTPRGIVQMGTLEDEVVLHVTSPRSIPSIMRNGLIPQRGPRSIRCETTPMVHAFTDVHALLLSLDTWLGESLGEEDDIVVVLAVDIKGIPRIHRDKWAKWEWCTDQWIPASRIVTMGRLALKDLKDGSWDVEESRVALQFKLQEPSLGG